MKRKHDSAWLCTWAAKNEEQIKKGIEKRGYKFIKFFDCNGLQAYLAECSEGQVLIFRESEHFLKAPEDWITNIKFLTKDTPIGKVHTGFYDVVVGIYPKIEHLITDKNIIVSGFSKGGCESIVFCKYHKFIKEIKGDYTNAFFIAYSPARVSKDKNFYLNGVTVMNGSDFVPLLPIKALGFRHTGDILYFTGRRGAALWNPKKWLYYLDYTADTILDIRDFKNGEHELDHNIAIIRARWEKEWDKRIKKHL